MKLDTRILDYDYPSIVEEIDSDLRQRLRKKNNEEKELRESRELTRRYIAKYLKTR